MNQSLTDQIVQQWSEKKGEADKREITKVTIDRFYKPSGNPVTYVTINIVMSDNMGYGLSCPLVPLGSVGSGLTVEMPDTGEALSAVIGSL